MLYAYVYEGNILYEPIHRRGLLATRSWEPSVTIRKSADNQTYEVTASIERLKLRRFQKQNEPASPGVGVSEKVYFPEESTYREVPLRTGDAYKKREVIVECPRDGEHDATFAEKQQSSTGFQVELLFRDLPRVFQVFEVRNSHKKIARDFTSTSKKKPFLTYLASWEER